MAEVSVAYDSDMIALLREILSDAWQSLNPNDQRFATLEEMARHLLVLVEAGESDPTQLRAAVQGQRREY